MVLLHQKVVVQHVDVVHALPLLQKGQVHQVVKVHHKLKTVSVDQKGNT